MNWWRTGLPIRPAFEKIFWMQAIKFGIGQFLLVIGVTMLAIFFVTYASQSPRLLLFFSGVLVVGTGLTLMLKNQTERTSESARFRSVRRYRQKARERREKKRQKLQERRER
jgi:ABC-type multidrug transport system fused ATPase/permease subunit